MLTAGEYCRGSQKAFIEVAMLWSYHLKIVLTGVDTAGTEFFIEEIGLCNHSTGDHACRGKWIIRKKEQLLKEVCTLSRKLCVSGTFALVIVGVNIST